MDKKITIKDIAQLAGTSKTTVSFYLNGKHDKMSVDTQERIARVIEETNYKPSVFARTLTNKKTHLIGVLIGDIVNSFSKEFVKGIEAVASKEGYQIVLSNTDYDSKREVSYIENMIQLGVDGFVIQPTSNARQYAAILEGMRKPIVFFDSQLYGHTTNWVKANNYDAVYDLVLQCIEKGYNDFILIGADASRLTTRIERATGFIDALTFHSYSYKELVIEERNQNLKTIHQFLKDNIDVNKKTLVFVPNCWALPMVFEEMKKLKVPFPTVGLVGFDNTEWSQFSSPSVTTIVQPAQKEGEEAFRILKKQLDTIDQSPQNRVLDCHINWQESTL